MRTAKAQEAVTVTVLPRRGKQHAILVPVLVFRQAPRHL